MQRLALILLAASACAAPRRLGGPGTACVAPVDCQTRLQCVEAVCTDPATQPPATPAPAPSGEPAEPAEPAAGDPASDERTAELQRQLAEKEALETEQGRLIEQLRTTTGSADRAQLEEKKSAIDAQLADLEKQLTRAP